MDGFKRQRGSVKSSLTYFSKYIDQNFHDNANISQQLIIELETRINNIEVSLLQKFTEIQDNIESACESAELEKEYEERADFENRYYSVISLAKKYLDEIKTDNEDGKGSSKSSQKSVNLNTAKAVKLPDINLPIFDGSLQNWLEFRDTFESLIHKNEALSDIQRFHYLRASVCNEPLQIVSSVEFPSDNYTTAWELVGKRYNKDKLLTHNHIKNVFNVEALSKESAKDMRMMLTSVTKNMRALNKMGLPTASWDVPMVYLLSTKLDKGTTREWESFKSKSKVYPSLEDFKLFLSDKAEFLENMEPSRTERQQAGKFRSLTAIDDDEKKFEATNVKLPKCACCEGDHYIQSCPSFLKTPVEKRGQRIMSLKLCLNCLRPGHFNKNCRKPTCKQCHKKHNTLLHVDKNNIRNLCDKGQESNIGTEGASSLGASSLGASSLVVNSRELVNNSANCDISEVLLSTAHVYILDRFNNKHTIRVILDSGSQSSFITERACDKLQLFKEKFRVSLNGINNSFSTINYKCNTQIFSKSNEFSIKVSCFVIPKITGPLPAAPININHLKIPINCKLADPEFFKPQEIDMLIGSDLFWEVLCEEKCYLGNKLPILKNTRLGWIVTGPVGKENKTEVVNCNFSSTETSFEQQIHEGLKRFWEIENINEVKRGLSEEELACEEHFKKNTTRCEDGSFVVRLPLKLEVSKLGSSFEQAKRRFLNLERKMCSNEQYKKLYHDFIKEYIKLGHMTKDTSLDESLSDHYFMCHHGVYRADAITTNLRVVFDASLPSCTGFSLNNIQMAGPTIQQDLFSILIRFRQHRCVVSADCTKMYRSVWVHPDERSLQRILWRFSPEEPLHCYQLKTLTYGTTSASFLAIRCFFQLALEIQNTYPDIAEVIKNDFYVDDLLTGANTVAEARRICNLVFKTLKQGCFVLRKFCTNDGSILDGIPNDDSLTKIVEFGENDVKKTLGLIWSPIHDILMYKGLWLEKLSWDDPVPRDIAMAWTTFAAELRFLNELKISRHAIGENAKSIEMHCFSDSSEKAYGACIYLRSLNEIGETNVCLLASKAKVAPLQTVTLPRLELCGALVASRLAKKISQSLRLKLEKICFWTDSTIVLGWIKTAPNKLKTFVGNRVAEIQETTSSDTWRHVPSQLNPADYLSRGLRCSEIKNVDVWWNGPRFLCLPETEWPKTSGKSDELPDLRKARTYCANSTLQGGGNYVVERFSNLLKLKRILALLHRFAHNCRKGSGKRRYGPLSKGEIEHAFKMLIKQVQEDSFYEEFESIKGNKIKSSSKIISLKPFIDEFGLLRVGGRLTNAKFSFEKKHPLILPRRHHLSNLIFTYEHMKLYHCGPQHLLASIRESYWPLAGRSLAKQIVHKCLRCFRYNPKMLRPIMGDLPEQRVTPNQPFDVIGVDYAGPFLLKSRSGRGAKLSKSYISLFICFLTKAVHLELVTDLSKESFILSLRRFVARRGKPSVVYSDNGTNFVAAHSELKDLGQFIIQHNDELTSKLCNEGIEWHFIPPQSPHFGGLWEAGVKSMKFHLKRVVSSTPLTFEHFYTLLSEVEAIMNSRPLSPLSSDPEDLTPLTPGHLLIGRQLSSWLSADLRSLPTNRLSLYQHLQQLRQHIWSRWSKEYVAELQQRIKWRQNYDSLTEGSLVLVKDDNAPPMRWKLGKIVEVFRGKDRVARVAYIKTQSGIIKRCFSKICPLPVN
ncbi:uncharacterized protein [Euwallacea similis]|uniref:uncharacterized protein n=1 Tax=Euwallacea similis TaxID=1736056 RepID=UPI0034502248